MSVLLLVNVAILLFTNEAISKCPPDSGKPTLNSVSCVICWLLLVGIYLMYNGDCYPNGSYFENTAITAIIFRRIFDWHMYLQCVLPNSTLSGGEWSRSNGGPVDCTSNTNSDPLRCITTNTPATLSLYKPYGQVFLYHLRINYTSVVYPLTVLILPISSLLIYSVSYLIVLVHTVIL